MRVSEMHVKGSSKRIRLGMLTENVIQIVVYQTNYGREEVAISLELDATRFIRQLHFIGLIDAGELAEE